MNPRIFQVKNIAVLALALCTVGPLSPPPAAAQTTAKFMIKAVAEKTVTKLPVGPLYWRVETLPTLALAQAATGPTSLAAEVAGKAWLFTLGPKGGSTAGATMVVDIGPVPPPAPAAKYLLRINNTGGPPGVKTPVHSHPGSETFYVLTGELSERTPRDLLRVEAGHAMAGQSPGTAMEVSNSGVTDLNALVMFVVDATKPFSSAAKFE